MLQAEGFVGVVLLVVWIFALVDAITTDSSLVRHLPKGVWILIIVLTFDIGAILWIILGRPPGARLSPGSTERRPPRAPAAPASRPRSPAAYNEDSAEFMREIEQRRLHAWEEDLKRREDELRRRASGEDPPPTV